jgi:hypothetical protein
LISQSRGLGDVYKRQMLVYRSCYYRGMETIVLTLVGLATLLALTAFVLGMVGDVNGED